MYTHTQARARVHTHTCTHSRDRVCHHQLLDPSIFTSSALILQLFMWELGI